MAIARIMRIWGTILLAITIFSLSFPAYAKYSGGTGEPNDPYQIATAEDLILLGDSPEDYDKHFILTADIDLDPNLPGRKIFDRAVIAPDVVPNMSGFQGEHFTGVFNGNGHVISHLTIKGVNSLGLFGILDFGATISNLDLVAVDVSGEATIGGLVGQNNGKIEDCYISGIVSGKNSIGGLVGSNSDMTLLFIHSEYTGGGILTNCYSTGVIRGKKDVGGLVGSNYYGTITDCHSTASMMGTICVGGLVGLNFAGKISGCSSSGNVQGRSESSHLGGLVGRNSTFSGGSTIINCYSCGDVSGETYLGGLVGSNSGGFPFGMARIINCYSTGTITGIKFLGGLVGSNSDTASIVNCYATGRVNGATNAGGLVGENKFSRATISSSLWDIKTSGRSNMCGTEVPGGSGCDDANGKTTAEMQTAATFLEAGWDFVDETDNGTEDIWKISEGLDYPCLWWEKYSGGTGDPNNPYRIATAEDLMLLGESPEDYDKHFIMIDDIDMDPNLPGRKVFDRAIIGNSWFFPFAGVFDGNGHVISNLNIRHSGQGIQFNSPINFGLFGQLQSESEVKNLGIADVNINIRISDNDYYKVGGIAGVNFGNVIQCHSTGSVIGGEFVGGLVGYNSGDVTVCYSGCAVNGIRLLLDVPVWPVLPVLPVWPGERSVEGGVGGLVGYNTGSIAMSCNTGSVRGSEDVGGLVGNNTGSIDMSYSTGAVSGNEYVGGLVGTNGSYSIPRPTFLPVEPNLPLDPTLPIDPYFPIDPNFPVDPNFLVLGHLGCIKNCYATGSVTGVNQFSGLVGENKYGEVVTSFWDIETSGVTSSNAGAGKTTAEMQIASTFLEAGWDFVGETENGTEDIWWILEGQDYPRLWWELIPEE